MFHGSWKESNEEVITLEIPDNNIDIEGKIGNILPNCSLVGIHLNLIREKGPRIALHILCKSLNTL